MAEHAYIDQSMRSYLSAVKIDTFPPISSHMDLTMPSSTAYICKEEFKVGYVAQNHYTPLSNKV